MAPNILKTMENPKTKNKDIINASLLDSEIPKVQVNTTGNTVNTQGPNAVNIPEININNKSI